MLSFNRPEWLLLFLTFPVLVWGRYFWRGRRGRVAFPFSIWGGDGFHPAASWLKLALTVTAGMFWLGAALLATALAGPEKINREEVYLSRGIDIMVVLDQSLSMGARDFPPLTRFDSAKTMIRRFVEGRSGDSIGLVSFGTDAVLRCPPTADYDWLLSRLDALELRDLGDDTSVGMGLAVAALHLADSTAEGKVILLLTDGDDNAGEIRPDTAAGIAAERDIRIYSVGIGSPEESPIEISNPETGEVIRGKIATKFNEDQLRSLAAVTGGGYWRANSPGALETVFQAVDSLENVERRVSVRVTRQGRHRPFLIAGAIIVLAAYIIRRFLMGESL